MKTTNYVYLKSKGESCWTVGFYDPSGKWIPESDHSTSEQAAVRVHYLNGGNKYTLSKNQWQRQNLNPEKATERSR